MKKIRIASLIVLIIAIVLFGAYKIKEFSTRDNTPPVITCPSDTITASVSITEEVYKLTHPERWEKERNA